MPNRCSLTALLRILLLGAIAIPMLIVPIAIAGPTDPVTIELPPEGEGDAFIPGVRQVADLPRRYVEEEFFISGTADLYNYRHDPPEGPSDTEVIESGIPYKTRILVRRPPKNKFKGTVVIEWFNSTAGFDTAPVWDPAAEYFVREGWIYVGLTNANQSLAHLVGGCSTFGILPPTCGTRYESLSMPDDGQIWDIGNQLANLLRNGGPDSPIPESYVVERVFSTGQSQQAGSMITFASGFHTPGIMDGYFVQAGTGARRINGGTSCDSAGAPAFPDCTAALQGDDRKVRADLPVPVVQAVTETDLVVLFGTSGRQPDTETFRYYEMAGTAHLTIHKGVEIIPAGLLGPDPLYLSDLCENEMNSLADGPVYGSYLHNAMWENLELQVRKGKAPPAGRLIELDGDGEIVRDEFGNAMGGVRVPEMDVPTGSHNPPQNQADPSLNPLLQQIGNLACFLSGSTTAFTPEELADLYGTKARYVREVIKAANALRKERFLLDDDRRLLIDRARGLDQLCGLGFEVALILPLVIAVRRGVRRRRESA